MFKIGYGDASKLDCFVHKFVIITYISYQYLYWKYMNFTEHLKYWILQQFMESAEQVLLEWEAE